MGSVGGSAVLPGDLSALSMDELELVVRRAQDEISSRRASDARTVSSPSLQNPAHHVAPVEGGPALVDVAVNGIGLLTAVTTTHAEEISVDAGTRGSNGVEGGAQNDVTTPEVPQEQQQRTLPPFRPFTIHPPSRPSPLSYGRRQSGTPQGSLLHAHEPVRRFNQVPQPAQPQRHRVFFSDSEEEEEVSEERAHLPNGVEGRLFVLPYHAGPVFTPLSSLGLVAPPEIDHWQPLDQPDWPNRDEMRTARPYHERFYDTNPRPAPSPRTPVPQEEVQEVREADSIDQDNNGQDLIVPQNIPLPEGPSPQPSPTPRRSAEIREPRRQVTASRSRSRSPLDPARIRRRRSSPLNHRAHGRSPASDNTVASIPDQMPEFEFEFEDPVQHDDEGDNLNHDVGNGIDLDVDIGVIGEPEQEDVEEEENAEEPIDNSRESDNDEDDDAGDLDLDPTQSSSASASISNTSTLVSLRFAYRCFSSTSIRRIPSTNPHQNKQSYLFRKPLKQGSFSRRYMQDLNETWSSAVGRHGPNRHIDKLNALYKKRVAPEPLDCHQVAALKTASTSKPDPIPLSALIGPQRVDFRNLNTQNDSAESTFSAAISLLRKITRIRILPRQLHVSNRIILPNGKAHVSIDVPQHVFEALFRDDSSLAAAHSLYRAFTKAKDIPSASFGCLKSVELLEKLRAHMDSDVYIVHGNCIFEAVGANAYNQFSLKQAKSSFPNEYRAMILKLSKSEKKNYKTVIQSLI